jgi:hypothetical protein
MTHKQRIAKFLVATTMVLGLVAVVSTVQAVEPEKLFNPLEATVDPNAPVQSLAAIFINALFGIAGSIALAMYVWGGVLWLTSAGEAKKVDQGKGVIQWTTLGIIMMFAAYTLVSYLFSSFGTGAVGGATGGASGAAGTPAGQSAGTSSKLCCLNYGTNKSMTVSNPGDCAGANTQVFNGACSSQKFCGSSGTVSGSCAPTLTNCPSGYKEFPSFETCMVSNVPAAGVGAKTVQQSAKCTAKKGTCIDIIETECSSNKLLFNLCPGSETVVCCVK